MTTFKKTVIGMNVYGATLTAVALILGTPLWWHIFLLSVGLLAIGSVGVEEDG